MSEHGEVPAGERVELVYTLTREDLTQAFKERSKVSFERWVRKLAPWMIGACAVMVIADLARGNGFDLNAMLGAALFGCVGYGLPALMGYQAHKVSAQLGEHRVVIDSDGWTIAHATASGRNTWRATPRYAECDDVFVLFSGDKYGACVATLPKRGIQTPADADTLRALLERHVTRV